MNKGCLLIAGLVVVAVVAVGGVIGYGYVQEFGLTEAPIVPHESLATSQTRLRIKIEPGLLQDYLKTFVPDDLEVPAWLPVDVKSHLGDVLPHEIAILAGSDFSTGTLGLTVFVNERLGGPIFVRLANESDLLAGVPFVQWATEGLTLTKRGALVANGTVPLPEQLESTVLEHWTHDAPAEPLTILGGHPLEIALDNRNGEFLILVATLMNLYGMDWQGIFANEDFKKMALPQIVGSNFARFTGDLADPDTIKIHAIVGATADAGVTMQFMFGSFILPQLQDYLKNNLNLKLVGNAKWDQAKLELAGDFTVTGLRDFVASRMGKGKTAAAVQ